MEGLSHVMDEGVEQGVVKRIAFGVVLRAQAERIIAEPRLFDHIVVRAPSLDFQAGTKLVKGLVMELLTRGIWREAPLA